FPRIDLVMSRNVLIYFAPELQRRALQLFAYSLRDGGYLVLGKAETTSPLGGRSLRPRAPPAQGLPAPGRALLDAAHAALGPRAGDSEWTAQIRRAAPRDSGRVRMLPR